MQWITEDGEFDLLIAASAADIRHTLTVTLASTIELPCILDKESTIREWMADPRGKAIVGPLLAQVETAARKRFGGEDERYGTDGAIGMDIMEMFNDMPLASVLMFQKDSWPKHPEDLVAELLEQVHSAD